MLENNLNGERRRINWPEPFETGFNFSYFYPDSNVDMVMRKLNYYLKVLSIFTSMFEKTLDEVNGKEKETTPTNWDGAMTMTKIEKYRRHKDFL